MLAVFAAAVGAGEGKLIVLVLDNAGRNDSSIPFGTTRSPLTCQPALSRTRID